MRSTDITNDRYGSGWLRRWTIVDGQPACIQGPLDTRVADPAEVAVIEATNTVIADRMAAVEAHEAALRLTAGDAPQQWVPGADADGSPTLVENAAWTAYAAAQATIAAASPLTLAYATVRAEAPPEPAEGEASPEWDAHQAAVALIEATPIAATPTAGDMAIAFASQQAAFGAAVQRHLDAAVQARDYADVATCVTYADEPSVPQYQAEGQAARAWRSQVWAVVYAVMAAVEAGEREPLSVAQVLAALPALDWPDM